MKYKVSGTVEEFIEKEIEAKDEVEAIDKFCESIDRDVQPDVKAKLIK